MIGTESLPFIFSLPSRARCEGDTAACSETSAPPRSRGHFGRMLQALFRLACGNILVSSDKKAARELSHTPCSQHRIIADDTKRGNFAMSYDVQIIEQILGLPGLV